MKKSIILILLFFVIFFVGCDPIDETIKVTSIDLVDSSIPSEIYIGEFDISDVEIKVNFSNGEEETMRLKKDMLSSEDFNKFSNIGSHTITVNYKGLTAKFSIVVKAKRPTSLLIIGDKEVLVDRQITLSVIITPSDASNEVIWTSLDPNIATVNQNGVVTGINKGKASIKVSSKLVNNLEEIYQITVISNEIFDPPLFNFNNYEIIIMTTPQMLSEYDPFSEMYLYADKEYKISAWNNVQDLYNVRMTVAPFPNDTPPYGPNRISWLIEKAVMNNSPADIIINYSDWIPSLVKAHAVVDVSEYYKRYGKNSMSPAIKESATYKDGLYQLPEHTMSKIQVNRGLIFNVNLLDSLQLENPAKLFNEGKWTVSKFEEYVTHAATVVGDNQSVLSGKPGDLYFGMANAAGIKLADTTKKEVNFKNQTVVNNVNLIKDLYNTPKVWGTNAYETYNTSFNEGRSIFQVAEYSYLESPGRFSSNLWGNDTKYGYVPFPYPDTMSKNDTKAAYEAIGPIYQIPEGKVYPENINSENIYMAFTLMMNLTYAYIISNPEIIENEFRINSASSKLDDLESVKAITYFDDSKLIFDPIYRLLPSYTHFGPMIDAVVVDGKDYFKMLEEFNFEILVTIKLEELYG